MVASAPREAGLSKLGCLFMLAILVVAVYVGKDVGQVYWRYYQLQDEVKSQASFAPSLTDKVILDRLVAMSDTLGVPLGPGDWYIKRTTRAPKEITISASYEDSVVFKVPGWRKVVYFHFHPNAKAEL